MVTITTVILHELGHAFLGTLVGCSEVKIFTNFPEIAPTTALTCSEGAWIVPMGAFLFTVPLFLAFMLVRGFPERELLWVVLGLIVFTASQDIVLMIGFQFLFPFFFIMGFGLIIYGENNLVGELQNTIKKEFKENSYYS